MAGPKIRWYRRKYDYWKYFANERCLTLSSFLILLLGITGITPIGPDFGYRDIISWIALILSGIVMWYDHLIWKNEIRKIHIRDFKGHYIPSFAPKAVIFGGRAFIISEDVNKAIRSRILKNKPTLISKPYKYKLHANAKKNVYKLLEYYHLGYSHGINSKPIKMWNDIKLRLHTTPENFTKSTTIELKKTSYFDYLGTAYFSLRECLYDNELFYDGESLLKYKDKLASIQNTKTAHHIGVNTLLITSDKTILYQQTKAPAAPDNQAPSGSGSLDKKDIDGLSFEKTLLNGALREFSEETGWASIVDRGIKTNLQNVESMFFWPLGMSVDLSRGMVTDFFFLVIAEKNSHFDYQEHYEDGKIKLDTFELKLKNSIYWKQLNTDSLESLKESIKKFYTVNNESSNSMLSISLDFLLKAIEEQKDVCNRLLNP